MSVFHIMNHSVTDIKTGNLLRETGNLLRETGNLLRETGNLLCETGNLLYYQLIGCFSVKNEVGFTQIGL